MKKYREEVKNISTEYSLPLVLLQEKFEEATKKYGTEELLFDGIHLDMAGATLIANEWLKTFEKINEKKDVGV